MYKTVRKGDASLQYTILPQTDHFSSGGFSQTSAKPRSRIVKYTMGTLMLMIVLSCVATPFLINQNDRNFFASTMLTMSRIESVRNTSRNQTKEIDESKSRGRIAITTMPMTEITKRKDLKDVTTSIVSGILRAEEKQMAIDDTTLAGIPEISTRRFIETLTGVVRQRSTTMRTTRMTSTLSPTTMTTTMTFPTYPAIPRISLSSTTENSKIVSSTSRKPKMPRVTLKLRENETIPQMYMKAGIASYKKGNITTSVLAHDLSLEGLIFKVPDGTIKPWPHKWFFRDPTFDIPWNKRPVPTSIYVLLVGLVTLAGIWVVLMWYAQWRISRRPLSNVEEPEIDEHEHEDKSVLLGEENQEIEEKE